ncbi:hypothetical protein AN639_05850 [Candidatus Epulonipiscium fishelsonii]|uniref:Uncharacterized protein n=1 Tax=Candidatus Epulonipiscium fishelsonii TaxID=77094 RepID=A0ACC8X826_9FIRM|nr:hypothetical protein AN396_11605 [Epulopiscium sp. SCG-B11WGA-EpuloA1]ONI39734.1 hypothetical protein AN639_05850 [Epulopiscium sp. SCG-B05WGA-EpuloA1]
MKYYFKTSEKEKTFQDIYIEFIKPQIEDIDILLKCDTPPYDVSQVASVLHTTSNEVITIMNKLNISEIGMQEFFFILKNADTYISNLILRQWKFNSVKEYTPLHISYIYNLNEADVKKAFEQLKVNTVNEKNLYKIFNLIILKSYISKFQE